MMIIPWMMMMITKIVKEQSPDDCFGFLLLTEEKEKLVNCVLNDFLSGVMSCLM